MGTITSLYTSSDLYLGHILGAEGCNVAEQTGLNPRGAGKNGKACSMVLGKQANFPP